ncbi:MAG: hypothetical protein HY830_11630 [Actinobacteria bacterium]|nr:hypothetical protein [Actinomycetota bacterium]
MRTRSRCAALVLLPALLAACAGAGPGEPARTATAVPTPSAVSLEVLTREVAAAGRRGLEGGGYVVDLHRSEGGGRRVEVNLVTHLLVATDAEDTVYLAAGKGSYSAVDRSGRSRLALQYLGRPGATFTFSRDPRTTIGPTISPSAASRAYSPADAGPQAGRTWSRPARTVRPDGVVYSLRDDDSGTTCEWHTDSPDPARGRLLRTTCAVGTGVEPAPTTWTYTTPVVTLPDDASVVGFQEFFDATVAADLPDTLRHDARMFARAANRVAAKEHRSTRVGDLRKLADQSSQVAGRDLLRLRTTVDGRGVVHVTGRNPYTRETLECLVVLRGGKAVAGEVTVR